MIETIRVTDRWLMMVVLCLLSTAGYAETQTNPVPVSDHSSVKRVYQKPARPIAANQGQAASQNSVADSRLAPLLARIKQQPADLELIEVLHEEQDALIAYARQRLVDKANPVTVDEAGVLIVALSLVDDKAALEALLKIGWHFMDDPGFTQRLLLVLRVLPFTDPVRLYVDDILTYSHSNPLVARSALLYYISVKNPAGTRWAAYYSSPDTDPQLRFVGLTLGAVLGDDSVTGQVLEQLMAQPSVPTYQQYFLLQGLYARVAAEEFDRLLPRLTVAPVVVKEFQRLRDFEQAGVVERRKLAQYLLNSPQLDQQQMALMFWLKQGVLSEYWETLTQAKRLSAMRLAHTHDLELFPEAGFNGVLLFKDRTVILYVIAGLLALALVFFRFRNNRQAHRAATHG